MKQVHFYMAVSLWEDVRAMAKERGVSVAVVIREALDKMVKEWRSGDV